MNSTKRFFLLVSVFFVCGFSNLLSAYDEIPKYTTNKKQFDLPVIISFAEAARTKEIQFYVSSDSGENWKKIASGPPSTTKFSFIAPKDGVYSFAVFCVAKEKKDGPASPGKITPQIVVEIKSDDNEVPVKKKEIVDKIHGDWQIEMKLGGDKKITRGLQIKFDIESHKGKLYIADGVGGNKVVTAQEFRFFISSEAGQPFVMAGGGPFKEVTVLYYTIDGDKMSLSSGTANALVGGEFSLAGQWTRVAPKK